MEPLGIFFALVTVLAWGSWLVPSQNVRFPNEQGKAFYVASANLVACLLVVAWRGDWAALATGTAWVPVGGGLIWAVSAYCAFVGCKHLGVARAFGIWAPLNIIVSFLWGLFLFGQFRDATLVIKLLAVESAVLAIMGVLMIIFAGGGAGPAPGKGERSALWIGVGGAVGAGILWGTYYIPSAFLAREGGGVAEISPWVAALPLAVGMFLGSAGLVAGKGRKPRLENPGAYLRALASGLLWSLGNFGMLLTVDAIGPGPGYTIASMCVVVNALWGIFLFRDPPPRSRAALLILVGIVLATLAGLVLGNLQALESA